MCQLISFRQCRSLDVIFVDMCILKDIKKIYFGSIFDDVSIGCDLFYREILMWTYRYKMESVFVHIDELTANGIVSKLSFFIKVFEDWFSCLVGSAELRCEQWLVRTDYESVWWCGLQLSDRRVELYVFIVDPSFRRTMTGQWGSIYC